MIKEGHRSALWLVVCIEVVTVCLISVVLFLAEIQVVTGDLAGFVRHVLSSCLKGR